MAKEPLPVFVFGCVSCGKTVAGTEKFCPRCGASFEDVKFECPFCGELVSPAQNKCPTCGTEFSAFADDVSETSVVDLDGGASPVRGDANAPPAVSGMEQVDYECPSCGKPVTEADVVCPHCGVRFG